VPTNYSNIELLLSLGSEESPPDRIDDSIVLVLELRLSADFPVFIVILSPPGFWISFNVSSSPVHFNVVLVLKADCDIVEFLLAVEDVPEEAFVDSAVGELHDGVVAFSSGLK